MAIQRDAEFRSEPQFGAIFVGTTAYAEQAAQPGRIADQQAKVDAALALTNTFATGDSAAAAGLIADGYIQHNLAYGIGRDAFTGSVDYLAAAEAPTLVANLRSFVDGDYVFLQTAYNFAGAGEQIAFDVFRFDAGGMICEHWDNLTALAKPNPSLHTQYDGLRTATDLDKTEKNRALVQDFLVDVL